jgi:TonB family protein
MRSTALARSALALGVVGLFTAGLCGLGAVLGLGLAIAAIGQARRSGRGGSVPWAAVTANVFALLSIAPWILLIATLRPMLPDLMAANPFAAPELPQPHESLRGLDVVPDLRPPPPPPPPPPPRRSHAATAMPADRSEQVSDVVEGTVPDSRPQRAVRVGGAIREPRKIRQVNPVYPDIAKSARVQGIVILEATIGPEGRVRDVRVLRGIPLLDGAAVDAVRQWEYTPTLLNGVPVPVIMTITVNFSLR